MTHEGSIVIGVFASIGAALFLSSGTVLQAIDCRRIPADESPRLSLLARLVRRPRWVLGTIVGYLAFPLQLLALRRAPLLVVQPVHALGLLLVLGAGARMMRERVGVAEFLGVATIIAGVAVLAWGAPTAGAEQPVSEAALAGSAVGLALLASMPYVLGRRCGRMTLMLCAGVGFAGANMAVKGFSDHMSLHAYPLAIGYLAIAAVASTVAVADQMSAFQRSPAVEVVPITFVVPNFLPTILALGVLREHWASAAFGGVPFAAGAALLLAGTAAVTRAGPVTRLLRAAAG